MLADVHISNLGYLWFRRYIRHVKDAVPDGLRTRVESMFIKWEKTDLNQQVKHISLTLSL